MVTTRPSALNRKQRKSSPAVCSPPILDLR